MKTKPLYKGINGVKHKLNLARVGLAVQEKYMKAYQELNVPEAIAKCQIEINKSKITILKLENKLIKHNNHGRILLHKTNQKK